MARYFHREESSLVRGVLAIEAEARQSAKLRASVVEIEKRLKTK